MRNCFSFFVMIVLFSWWVSASTSSIHRGKVSCCSTPSMTFSYQRALGNSRFQLERIIQKQKYWGYTQINLSRKKLYSHMILPILRRYKVPDELLLLAAAESSYKARVLSPSHASGVWQFIPSTGKQYGLKITPWRDERRNIEKATHAAARYLRFLYRRYGRWEFAVAGYNCGEKQLDRVIKRCPKKGMWDIINTPACRLPDQTKHYVSRIYSLIYYHYHPQHFKKKLRERSPVILKKVQLKQSIDLLELTEKTGVSMKKLWRDNSELSSWFTPPDKKFSLLVSPEDYKVVTQFVRKQKKKLLFLFHSVKRTKDLYQLAKKKGLPWDVLQALNHFSSPQDALRQKKMLIPVPVQEKKWTFLKQPDLLSLVQKTKRFFEENPEVRLAQESKHPFPFYCEDCIYQRPSAKHLELSTLQSIRFENTQKWTRIFLSFDKRVQVEEGNVEENLSLKLPKRVFLDIAPCKIAKKWQKNRFAIASTRVHRIRMGRNGRSSRFVLELQAEQKTRVTLLSSPMRVIIDISDAHFPSLPDNALIMPSSHALKITTP